MCWSFVWCALLHHRKTRVAFRQTMGDAMQTRLFFRLDVSSRADSRSRYRLHPKTSCNDSGRMGELEPSRSFSVTFAAPPDDALENLNERHYIFVNCAWKSSTSPPRKDMHHILAQNNAGQWLGALQYCVTWRAIPNVVRITWNDKVGSILASQNSSPRDEAVEKTRRCDVRHSRKVLKKKKTEKKVGIWVELEISYHCTVKRFHWCSRWEVVRAQSRS